MPLTSDNLGNNEYLVTCPWCNVPVRARPVTTGIRHTSQGIFYCIVQCPHEACLPFLIVIDSSKSRDSAIEESYPLPRSKPDQFDQSIPEAIRADYAEACRCWHIQSYKASVVMCRRVMQAVAGDKGALGDKLHQQLDDLKGKGLITTSLHEVATEVRHFGNFGAHPRDDGLDNVTIDDAKSLLDLTYAFLDILYIKPSETERLRQKRTQGP